MRASLATLQLLAPTDLSIMLVGESGTGKTRLARAVHEEGPSASGRFIVLAKAANAETIAREFALARGGTLLIEDVAELSFEAQTQLLSLLDAGVETVRPLSTTQRELEGDVLAGRFSRELYFRLAGAVVRIPTLRERAADLPVLARELLDELGRPELSVSSAALERLRDDDRPGNVQTLRDTLLESARRAEHGMIEPQHLPSLQPLSDSERLTRLPLAGLPLGPLEHAAIVQTLALCRGNKVRAARVLGIAVSTLYEKLKRHGL